MKKLVSVLKQISINTFCLALSDRIFDFINREELTREFNKLSNNDIVILLYKKPQEIKEKSKQEELIKYHHVEDILELERQLDGKI